MAAPKPALTEIEISRERLAELLNEDLSREYTELADEELEEIEREIADEAERDLQEADSDANGN